MNWYKKARKWKDHIPGGYADGKKPSDYNRKNIEKGKNIEFEHTDNPDTAREITMDHLEEHKKYYQGLEEMEKKLKREEKEVKKKKRKTNCEPMHSMDIHCNEEDDGW